MSDLVNKTVDEYENRKDVIKLRLVELSPPVVTGAATADGTAASATKSRSKKNVDESVLSNKITSRTAVPIVFEKKDLHWDYVLKEMAWLSTDFSSERKRHIASSKKLANSVQTYCKNTEQRRIRSLTEAEVKRRKLAAKISRETMKWWTKIEKVITYKQKISADNERRTAMNQTLVKLVQQTEKYTQSSFGSTSGTNSGIDAVYEIEAVLQQHDDHTTTTTKHQKSILRPRKSKQRVRDYATFMKEADNNDCTTLYGESTDENDSGGGSDDETYVVPASDGSNNHEEEDDETTIQIAEGEVSSQELSDELALLHTEATMDIEDVVQILTEQSSTHLSNDETVSMDIDAKALTSTQQLSCRRSSRRRNVQFASTATIMADCNSAATSIPSPSQVSSTTFQQATIQENNNDAGCTAVVGGSAEEEEEFSVDESVQDDETTMIQEENLPQEHTAEQELSLLQEESELSVEELRRRYSCALESDNIDVKGDDSVIMEEQIQKGDDVAEHEESELNSDAEAPDLRHLLVEDRTVDDNAAANATDNDEYNPNDGEEPVDDETTIAAEEKLGRDISYEDEISLLNEEGSMPIEQLRAMYGETGNKNNDTYGVTTEDIDSNSESQTKPSLECLLSMDHSDAKNVGKSDIDGSREDGDDDYIPDAVAAADDETTMEAEEKLGRDMSYKDEIALLEQENEMSVEELRALYSGGADTMECDTTDEKATDTNVKNIESSSRKTKKRETSPIPRSSRKRVKQENSSDDVKTNTPDAMEAAAEAAFQKIEDSVSRAQNFRVSRPFLIPPWVKLREYQQVGLNWLVSLHARRLNGILADEMGLGKTLQTISVLAYLASYRGIWGPHLIVVPTSVILNWETELKRFCPALKVLCYYGTAKRRKELRTGWTKSNLYHVVVTSYQLAVQDSFAFKRKRWYYLVLDEAQNIKNFQSQRWQTLINFNTQRRLLLTGTPLQNDLMELWSLLHFLSPYIFKSRKEFSYWFANPMTSMIQGEKNQNDSLVNRLHGIIRPFVLRRLKKDVETQLPGKFEHVVKCPLSRRQMFIYEEFMARSSTRQAMTKGGNFMGMMNVLMSLRKVCNHPDLFEPRSIITPLILPRIVVDLPLAVVGMTKSRNCLDVVCEGTLSPLWCGSEGSPSLTAALNHSVLTSTELMKLEAEPKFNDEDTTQTSYELCPFLLDLTETVKKKKQRDKLNLQSFQSALNCTRCRTSSFPYDERLLVCMQVDANHMSSAHDSMQSPSHLLAMRKSQHERANDVRELVKKFVFCVPKASALEPSSNISIFLNNPEVHSELCGPVETYLDPCKDAQARLSSFFPDRKLIQFDAGKLQTLSTLLHERKKGGHKVLIFTQMSKMLDILEAFLNLNGHTYLRLDGSTGVDRRQRLMDRFNNDPKIFCFILSTRSGGVGINLTGADTVVFYDSDWNPAQDSQASARAHRIGQTREVHIYRLITEHSVEENILLKAQQKKNLDIMVMDKGNFNASDKKTECGSEDSSALGDIYSKGGLRAIIGVETEQAEGSVGVSNTNSDEGHNTATALSKEQIEKAMESLEDIDDVKALRGAKKEAAEELKEFDESIEYKHDSDADEDGISAKKKTKPDVDDTDEQKRKEKELENEFAAWQEKVGMDADAIASSLSPMERYGLTFREEVDPFYSIYAVQEYHRRLEAQNEEKDEIDIDEIELTKTEQERLAFEQGDLLGTNITAQDLIRQRNLYVREKSRLKGIKKRRKLTGENWESRSDGRTDQLFWYNIDTGESRWDKPPVLIEMEEYIMAEEKRWSALPMQSLVHVMSFLAAFPGRMVCSQVSRHWGKASTDITFVRHVYPVEMGAYTRDDSKVECNHYRTIHDAVAAASPGDTIELADGHYWLKSDLHIDIPLRFVGDENNPSNVVIEMNGAIHWRAKAGGFVEGICFRRTRLSADEIISDAVLRIETGGRLKIAQSICNNTGSSGATVEVNGGWLSCNNVVVGDSLSHGMHVHDGSQVEFTNGSIQKNEGSGVVCCGPSTRLQFEECKFCGNTKTGIVLEDESTCTLTRCTFIDNREGSIVFQTESQLSSSSSNICSPTDVVAVQLPYFSCKSS